jgi:hypothetical protein
MKTKTTLIAFALITTLISSPQAFPAGKTSLVVKEPVRSSKSIPNTILSGNVIPLKTVGIDGDFYIDLKSANLYGPKTKGVWKLATTLRVPETKDVVVPVAGIDGAKGNTGEQGLSGANGTNGAAGAKGADGVKGADGAKGATGLTGATGSTGYTGATGSIGATGAKGETGASGLAGAAGTNGTAGAKGDTGTAGTNGVDGSKGDTGLAGAKGDTGIQGVKGDTGLTGSSGSQGATGSAGAAGISSAQWVAMPLMTLASDSLDGSTPWVNFGVASADGSFTFQIILDGTLSGTPPTLLSIKLEVEAAGVASNMNLQIMCSDGTSFVNGSAGRRIQFVAFGTITSTATSTLLKARVSDMKGNISGLILSFNGTALITKVGSIG